MQERVDGELVLWSDRFFDPELVTIEPQLGRRQREVVDFLESSDFAHSVWEIAMTVCRNDVQPPDDSETRSVYTALKRLERRGLAMSYKTWVRDVGWTVVWTSLLTPVRGVFDPGG